MEKTLKEKLNNNESNYIQTYQCLVSFFGYENIKLSHLLSVLINAENFQEDINNFWMCTNSYLNYWVPGGRKSISKLIFKLKEYGFIDTYLKERHRYICINHDLVLEISNFYNKFKKDFKTIEEFNKIKNLNLKIIYIREKNNEN